MKILLIVPTHRYKGHSYLSVSDFPTGLAYLSSALKKAGHEVVGLNLNNMPKYPSSYAMMANELHKVLEDKPDLIGLGGLCTDYPFIKDAMEVIRRYSQVPIVMGGGIINNDRDFVMELLQPDFCIWGEGEEAIVKLADALENDERPDIDNVGYWTAEGPVYGETNYDYGNLDDKVFPDYEPFGIAEMLDDYSMATRILYKYPRAYPRPMTINTARHCPFNCSFCVHSGGPKYRARSIENIMDEIKELYDKYKFNILIIGDELFAANKKRFDKFCVELIRLKEEHDWDFDWMFQTHANSKLDKESLELAKKAGCFFFSYGMESASPEVLKSMNKKANVQQFIEAIELSKDVGIGFGGNLLFGDPVETEATIHETLDFWAKHCQQSQVFLTMLVPYPGCKIFDYCIEKGIIRDKKQYYESIEEEVYNMTLIPAPEFSRWVQFLKILESSWMLTESTKATKVEEEEENGPMSNNGHRVFKVFAECPFCGKDNMYREIWNRDLKMSYLGMGCQHCNQRIKIKVA